MVATRCLEGDQYTPAWSCDLSVYQNPQFQILVTPAQGTSPDLVRISASGMRTAPVKYGTQPPSMDKPQKLSVAIDQSDLHAGLAYVFQVPYNKLVILHEDEFNPEGKSKRAIEDIAPPRRGMDLQPKDRPWYCYWNNTILEGFIYVTNDVPITPLNSTSSNGPLATQTSAASQESTAPDLNNLNFPSYPKLVRLEERRDPMILQNGIKPYCQQMQVLNDMNLGTVNKPDSNEPMIISLDETDPVFPKWKRSITRWTSQKSYDSDHCLCEWTNR